MNLKFALGIATLVAAFPAPAAETKPNSVFSQVDDMGWQESSEIAHYVGAKPEGPFRFHDVALRGTGTDTWDKYAPHNPEVRKFGDIYVLTYIANSDFRQPPHPANQRIGMAVSKSPDGPWRKVGKDGLILGPSTDPKHWTYGSQIVNPTLIEVSGKYHLYFKEYDPDNVKKIYGGDPKIERPKLLMEGGQPAWLYGPSGWNVTGGQRTVVHALRIHLEADASPLPTP
jgi:hypothetical protein